MKAAGKLFLVALMMVSVNTFAQSNEWENRIFDWFNTQRMNSGKSRVSFDIESYKESEKIQDQVADKIIDKKYKYTYTRDIALFKPELEKNVKRIVAYNYIRSVENEGELIDNNHDFACQNIIEELKTYVQGEDIQGMSVNVSFNELSYTEVGKRDYLVTFDIIIELPKPPDFSMLVYSGNANFARKDQSKAIFGYQVNALNN